MLQFRYDGYEKFRNDSITLVKKRREVLINKENDENNSTKRTKSENNFVARSLERMKKGERKAMENLKILESYISQYKTEKSSTKSLNELTLGFIRQGKYDDTQWTLVGGSVPKDLLTYIKDQDTKHKTKTLDCRTYGDILLPSNKKIELKKEWRQQKREEKINKEKKEIEMQKKKAEDEINERKYEKIRR